MKTGIFLIYFSLLLTQLQIFADSEKDWYPFVIPEKLYHDSSANIGKLVLDAPAGKHGFLKTKGSEFIFEDGTPIKFWGTNLCFEACFPDKQQAVVLADRLAFFGFNAVRLHHMDFHFEPRGIFKDVSPDAQDPQMKKTGILSQTQLDKLDFFIYQLKQRGIYVDMNLLVSRHFTKADGVVEADKLGMAAKSATMFDPKLIELQKQYAKDLLTHNNPYTQLRYGDDPVIALAEITNENSILRAWKNNRLNSLLGWITDRVLPQYYSLELDDLWQRWLKDKYKTAEALTKALNIKTQGKKTSRPIILKNSEWSLEQHKKAKAQVKIENNQTVIKVTSAHKIPYYLQYRINKIKLKNKKKYKITFSGKADKPFKLKIILQESFPEWKNLGLSESILLNSDFQTFSFPFAANSSCRNSKLAFLIGSAKAEIVLKDIRLEEISDIAIPSEKEQKQFAFPRPIHKLKFLYPETNVKDIEEFYHDIEKKYFNQMLKYLKDKLKLKIPITGSSFCDEISQSDCNYIDRHTYWDHPSFPNKSWHKNDFIITGESMLYDTKQGMINTLSKPQLINKPYTLTEWNPCFPNRYAYEAPLIMASESIKNNLSGLFQFAFCNGWQSKPEVDKIRSFFDSIANPQQLTLLSSGSFLYLKNEKIHTSFEDKIYRITSPSLQASIGFIKGKRNILNPFFITPRENGAVTILKTSKGWLLTLINRVKNTDMGWRRHLFYWGESPVLLKRISADIEFKVPNTNFSEISIFELLPDGKKGKKINYSHNKQNLRFSNSESDSPWLEVLNS